MYLDDITLGGMPEAILHDLEVIKCTEEIGLCLMSEFILLLGQPFYIGEQLLSFDSCLLSHVARVCQLSCKV